MSNLQELKSSVFSGSPLAVVGHPVKHSLSPRMHNAALQQMALVDSRYKDWHYAHFDILPEELAQALPFFWEKGFVGMNLTLPHKVQALDLVCRVDPAAAAMGAVNTLHRTADGYVGYNTDGYGLARAVEEAFSRPMQAFPAVILLGAGGAARAIAAQCLIDGVSTLFIGNRNQERLRDLLAQLAPVVASAQVIPFDLTASLPEFPEGSLVINATSLGLKELDPSPMPLDTLSGNCCVYDATYGVPSNGLQRECRKKGFPYASGISMLLWQGVKALEIWTGGAVPVDVMRGALNL